jgi:hypothetical protein
MKRTSFTLVISVLLCLSASISLSGRQTAGTSSQALLYLQQSLSQLVGTTSIADVTLTGSVRRIAGSDDETGTFTLIALAPGASRMNLSFPSGQLTEVHNLSASTPFGSWTGPDGTPHSISYHNILGEPVWVSPSMMINALLSSSQIVTTYVGQETKTSEALQHVAAYQKLPGTADGGLLFQHLTQMDLYLDSSTLLPATVDFSTHPDNNAGIDIPVEIQFSDYRTLNGVRLPFHIQKYVNGSLYLDFQVGSVLLNSGVSPSAFSVQ